jgi:hypothetical protein
MSEEHYQAQCYIRDFFGEAASIEEPIGERIADVFVQRPSGKPWMFEVQGVTLVPDEQIARTLNHCSHDGAAMTWLILKDISEVKLAEDYTVSMYEKWAYGANSETDKFNDGHVWWIDGKRRKLFRVEYKNAMRYITDHSTGRVDHPVPKIDERHILVFGPYELVDIKFTTRVLDERTLRYGTFDKRHAVHYPKFKRLIMSEKCSPVRYFGDDIKK